VARLSGRFEGGRFTLARPLPPGPAARPTDRTTDLRQLPLPRRTLNIALLPTGADKSLPPTTISHY